MTSSNIVANAITLRGDQLAIDTSSNPALVGATPIDGGPARATITGLNSATAMAFDAEGNLYVADSGDSARSSVFAPGSTAPTSTLSGLTYPGALAFDAKGNLYVADTGADAVYVFAPGATTPTSKLTGVDWPDALAIRRPWQRLRGQRRPQRQREHREHVRAGQHHAPRPRSPGSICPRPWPSTPAATSTWPTSATERGLPRWPYSRRAPLSPARIFTGRRRLTPWPSTRAATFTRLTSLNGTVSVYPPGATSASATITGLDDPDALAFDKRGNLFVANAGQRYGERFRARHHDRDRDHFRVGRSSALRLRRERQPLRARRQYSERIRAHARRPAGSSSAGQTRICPSTLGPTPIRAPD